MMSEEDKISLVMEGDHSSSTELRIVREKWSKQTSNRVSKTSVEVVQDYLWHVFGCLTTVLNAEQDIYELIIKRQTIKVCLWVKLSRKWPKIF